MLHLNVVFAVASALLGLGICNAASAQQAIPLPVEDALKVRSFADFMPARFSPDGKKLAYTVQDHSRQRSFDLQLIMKTGISPWGIGGDIRVLDVASGESKSITEGIADNWLPAWSPDGHYLAFLSDRGNDDHASLWIWDAARSELRKVCDARILLGPGANDILWTPDSRQIVVTAAPERPVIDVDIRESALPVPQQLSPGKPESTVVLYSSDDGPSSDKKAPSADPWDLDMYHRDLIVVDASHGSYRPLMQRRRIALYRLSPDGSHIAYTIPKRFERPGSQQILFDLATVAIPKGEEQILASDIRLEPNGEEFSWSPDGSRIALRTGGMGERVFDCYVVALDGGVLQNVTSFAASEPRRVISARMPLWDPKGSDIYLLRDGALWRATLKGRQAAKVSGIPGRRIVRLIHRSESVLWTSSDDRAIAVTHDDLEKRDGLYGVDLLHGSSLKLLEAYQCYTCAHLTEWQFADVTGDGGSIAFYAEDAGHSADLWISDPSFRSIRRVSHLNPQFDKVAMGSARLVEWRSQDGQLLKGALLLPPKYERDKRYPLLVWVYGNVSLSDRVDQFGLGYAVGYAGPFNMQLFATRDYAVLMPDAPQRPGTPMADLARAVLPGVDKVIDMGIVDPDRIGIMGHSYGSYSVLSLIVQTQRFKAALAADGTGDLISAYGQMDAHGAAYQTAIMEGGQGLMGGPPWEFPQRYIENSPLFYLDRVNTPLLIVHGAQDRAVSSFLGDEIFVGLRRLGKTVLYAKYQGEDHSPRDWSYENQLDLTNRMIAWFNKYLKKSSDARYKADAQSEALSKK